MNAGSLSVADWHARFTGQMRWTASVRRYLFERVGLGAGQRVLDVGCGTGALLPELLQATQAKSAPPAEITGSVHGLDINLGWLYASRSHTPSTRLTHADAHYLPYASASFDLALCHFLLLWLDDPARALHEMRRVVRPGGWVLLLAEPDYGGRIDHPLALAELGRLQTQALQAQGADPFTGRRLAELLLQAGFAQVESGVLGGQWQAQATQQADWQAEWAVLEADLAGQVPASELERLKRLDAQAHQQGARILFVPTFFALGRVE